jgi:uncharacterized DUF497 family protein
MTFDPDKERRNLAKHGISLSRMTEMTRRIAIYSPRGGEDRWVWIGWLDGRLYSGVIANREGGRREISLRPANRREQKDYTRAYPV